MFAKQVDREERPDVDKVKKLYLSSVYIKLLRCVLDVSLRERIS